MCDTSAVILLKRINEYLNKGRTIEPHSIFHQDIKFLVKDKALTTIEK